MDVVIEARKVNEQLFLELTKQIYLDNIKPYSHDFEYKYKKASIAAAWFVLLFNGYVSEVEVTNESTT